MVTRETFAFCCQCKEKFSIKETCKYCNDLVHDVCNGCSYGYCTDCAYDLDVISNEEFKKRVRSNV